ncbi:MAG: hypothetical protein ACPGQS_00455 [Bradymonadia bacterium]
MQEFIALDLKSLWPGDVLPVQLFVRNTTTLSRVLESGEPVTARLLEDLEKTHTAVLVRAEQCRALADYIEFNVIDGRQECLPAFVVSRLSQIVFNNIDSASIESLWRATLQIVHHQHRVPLSAVIACPSVQSAHPWVRRQLGIAWFMAMILTDSKMHEDTVRSGTFAALVHELDVLVDPSIKDLPHTYPSVTLSILARHYPVDPVVYEMLLLYRERIDGSGLPFGYEGHQVPPLAQYLGLANWLGTGLTSPLRDVESKLSRPTETFSVELVEQAQRLVSEMRTE